MIITYQIDDLLTPDLVKIQANLTDLAGLNAAVAAAGEKFIKTAGKAIASSDHKSANRLGARPTRHLEKAYQKIEHTSDSAAATLLIPRATRLRAAFGSYTLTPGGGKTYLTIPVNAAAYGRRAGEIPGLIFLRVGPNKTPILARPDGDKKITTYYLLVKKAEIAADEALIPFTDLAAHARDTAELFLLPKR